MQIISVQSRIRNKSISPQSPSDPLERTTLELLVLATLDRGVDSLYGLHRALTVSVGAISPMLRRLQDEGFIERQAHPEGQKKQLSLTSTGKAILRQQWFRKITDIPPDFETILRRAWLAVLMDEPQTGARYLRSAAAELAKSYAVAPRPEAHIGGDVAVDFVKLKSAVYEQVSRAQSEALIAAAERIDRIAAKGGRSEK